MRRNNLSIVREGVKNLIDAETSVNGGGDHHPVCNQERMQNVSKRKNMYFNEENKFKSST